MGQFNTDPELSAIIRDLSDRLTKIEQAVSGGRLLNQPAARASTSSFSLPSGTTTPFTLTSEVYDTDGIYDLIANPSRFTCRTPGVYSIAAYVAQPGTTGQRFAHILYNGSVAVECSMDANSAGFYWTVSTQLRLAIGDYVEVASFQNTGVAVNGCTGHLAMVRVGTG